jgi:hypothetical protein
MKLWLPPVVLTINDSERLGRLITALLGLDDKDKQRLCAYVSARRRLKARKLRHWRFRGH